MKKNFLFFALAALALCSCSESDVMTPDGGNDGDRVAARFIGSTFNVQPASTRATTSVWSQTGSIGIFALDAATTDIADGYANVTYTYSANNRNFNPDSDDETIYFPVDGSYRRFVSYFPYKELEGTTYEIDLTTQPALSEQSRFELLWSGITGTYNKEQPTVDLNFDHQFAKVTVTLTAGDGISSDELADIAVAITDMHLKADFDLLTGTMTTTDAASPLVLTDQTDNSAVRTALVMPTAVAAGRTMTFTLGQDTFRWDISDKSFDAGKTYDYTVSVNRTPMNLKATVTDWEEGEWGDGFAD